MKIQIEIEVDKTYAENFDHNAELMRFIKNAIPTLVFMADLDLMRKQQRSKSAVRKGDKTISIPEASKLILEKPNTENLEMIHLHVRVQTN